MFIRRQSKVNETGNRANPKIQIYYVFVKHKSNQDSKCIPIYFKVSSWSRFFIITSRPALICLARGLLQFSPCSTICSDEATFTTQLQNNNICNQHDCHRDKKSWLEMNQELWPMRWTVHGLYRSPTSAGAANKVAFTSRSSFLSHCLMMQPASCCAQPFDGHPGVESEPRKPSGGRWKSGQNELTRQLSKQPKLSRFFFLVRHRRVMICELIAATFHYALDRVVWWSFASVTLACVFNRGEKLFCSAISVRLPSSR